MEIKRINSYNDFRFSQRVLNQHGCFLVEDSPYEIEIISEKEALVRGERRELFPEIIEEFRFYTPHITRFYDINHNIFMEYPDKVIFQVSLSDIQPSQFYVDKDKIDAIRTFIHSEDDIIIQVAKQGKRYISLDGHTRLYYAVIMGWTRVRAVEETANDTLYGFVEEAMKRNIHTPYDLELVNHEEYEVKWNRFCDDYFAHSE